MVPQVLTKTSWEQDKDQPVHPLCPGLPHQTLCSSQPEPTPEPSEEVLLPHHCVHRPASSLLSAQTSDTHHVVALDVQVVLHVAALVVGLQNTS